METLSIQKVETCDFCVQLFVKSKLDGFEWILVGVYGVPKKHLTRFFGELFQICENESFLCW
jgi:hypothetical protein